MAMAVSLSLLPTVLLSPSSLAKGGRGGGVYLTTPEPTNPLEHNNRAVELGTKGLWDNAIREHEIALDGDPYNEMFKRNLSGAHLRYADILAGKKHYKEAIKHYTLALYADQNNGPADANRDATLRRIGKNPSSGMTGGSQADFCRMVRMGS